MSYSEMKSHNQTGQFQEALEIGKSIQSVVKDTLSEDYALVLNELAVSYKGTGNKELAESHFLKSLMTYKKLIGTDSSNLDYASVLINMASFYSYIGQFQKAEIYYKKGLSYFPKDFNNSFSYAMALSNLAIFYNSTGRYSKAKSTFQQSLKILQSLLDHYFPAYEKLLKTYGDNHPSTIEVNQSLQNIGLNIAVIMVRWASIYDFYKDYDIIEEYHREALTLVDIILPSLDKRKIFFLTQIGDYYNRHKQYTKAQIYYQKSLKLSKLNGIQPGTALLNNQALLYRGTRDFVKADSIYKIILKRVENLYGENHPEYAALLFNIALLYHSSGQPQKAELFFENSFSLTKKLLNDAFAGFNETEQRKYFEELNYRFSIFFSFIKKYEISQAGLLYSNHLFTKGLLLNAQQNLRKAIYNSSNEDTIIALWEKYQSQSQLYAHYVSLPENQLEALKINLQIENQKPQALMDEIISLLNYNPINDKIGWKDIKAELDEKEASIEIVRFNWYDESWTDSIIYAALILKKELKHPKVVFLGNGKALENEGLDAYYKSLFNETDSWYDEFWEPIQRELAGIERVYLSTDGVYSQINLDVLKINDETYLSDVVKIIRLVSTADVVIYDNLRKELQSQSQAVIVGGVDYNHGVQQDGNSKKWQPLYHSMNTITDISNVFNLAGIEVKLIADTSATESEVINSKNPRILHLDTHGFFAERPYDKIQDSRYRDYYAETKLISSAALNPMLRSGLVMAGANLTEPNLSARDGILTSYEIANLMDLRATELVVLSACDSGQGGNLYGEGIYGLQRAIRIAGGSSLIMSLWKIQEQVAKDFFSKFYSLWIIQGMDKRAAFNKAREHIKEEWEDTGHWGALIYIGN